MLHKYLPVSLKTFAAAAALFAASTTASASVITFTDPAAFAAAAGAVLTENFNRYAQDVGYTAAAPSFNFGAFSVRTQDVQGGSRGWEIDAQNTRNNIDGTTNLLIVFDFFNAFSELRFAEPITSFGFWYAGRRADLDPTSASRINVDADGLSGFGSYAHLATLTLENGSTPRFIGVTADQPFNRIVLNRPLCCSTSYSMDNVMYTPVGAVTDPGGNVPEPGSLALVASALGLLTWRTGRSAFRGQV